MRELKIGERIPIEAGGEAVVSRELGRGGQGIVYLVRRRVASSLSGRYF